MPRTQWNAGTIDINEDDARYGRWDDDPDLWDEALTREPTREPQALGKGRGYDGGDEIAGGL